MPEKKDTFLPFMLMEIIEKNPLAVLCHVSVAVLSFAITVVCCNVSELNNNENGQV